jgi:hypothetical protein
MKSNLAIGEIYLFNYFASLTQVGGQAYWLNWTVGESQVSFLQLVNLLMYHHQSYRDISSFGRDTIRRFSSNCSELKHKAAQDFENLLQVHPS